MNCLCSCTTCLAVVVKRVKKTGVVARECGQISSSYELQILCACSSRMLSKEMFPRCRRVEFVEGEEEFVW